MKLQPVSDAALRAFKELPKDVQEDFATSLQEVLEGRDPKLNFKHLNLGKGVKGVIELIINGSPAFRVAYVTKFNNTLYILHAFTKTAQGVDEKAMKLVAKRYKEIPK
jgi:phage-related protein